MNAHNNKDDGKFFKHGFTLKQFATLALVSNWALEQSEVSVTSQHYFNIFEKKSNQTPEQAGLEIHETFPVPKLIKEIRNFFSHAHHEATRTLQQKEAEYYTQLAPRILQFVEETISKNPELSAEERKKWAERYTFYKENPKSLFSFKTGAIFEWKNRFELLFILAPYLNRSQIEFAFKKMGLSKKDREKNEKRKNHYQDKNHMSQEDRIPFPITEHDCRSEILRTLAQHENIFLRRDSDRSEAVLSPADEQAFSLWEMVRTTSGQGKGKPPLTPPSIEVMMQYMVQFIENQNLLPSFHFARIKTIRLDTSDGQNQRLKQELVFTHKQEWPLRIRHRTILAEYTPEDTEKATYDTKINLGYLALRRLIALYLENPENSKTPENLPDQFLSDWLKENTPKMTKPKANPEPLQVRLKSRLNSMKAKTGNIRNKGTKQDKIPFFAGNINHTYRAETGKPLSSAAYKKLESEVRYFSKVHLREYISENLRVTLDAPSLLDSLKTQLGSPKPKALKNVICKENLEDVCTEFADAHLKWIEAKYSQIDAATDAELNSLAEDIRLKAPKTRETRQIQPVGIPPKAIIVPKDSGKALYGIFKNKTGSLITFDIQPVNRAQPNNKAKIAQYWKDATSWHFLLAMAVTHLRKGEHPINIDRDSPMQPLSSFPITCRVGVKILSYLSLKSGVPLSSELKNWVSTGRMPRLFIYTETPAPPIYRMLLKIWKKSGLFLFRPSCSGNVICQMISSRS